MDKVALMNGKEKIQSTYWASSASDDAIKRERLWYSMAHATGAARLD